MSDPAPTPPSEPESRPHVSIVPAGAAEPYRRLAEIFHDVLSEQSPDALLERIADTLAELIPYEDVHIYEADEAKRELIPVLARSKWAGRDHARDDSVRAGHHRLGRRRTASPCSRTRRTSTRAYASSRARRSSPRR